MIVVKSNNFLIFALFSMLVIFSAAPSWADSWVSVGGKTYYYNNASVADSGTAYIAAESSEADRNDFSEDTTKSASEVNSMTPEQKAKIEVLKLDSSSSSTVNDSSSLISFVEQCPNLKILNLSDVNFTSDASEGDTQTVTLNLTQLPANITTVSIANNPTVTDVVINDSMEEFSAAGCPNFKNFKLPEAGEASVAAAPALKKLYLTGTGITELDLSSCVNLETLIIADCKLDGSKLNIEGLTKLTKIDISGNRFLKFNSPSSVTSLICDTQTGDINVAPSDSLNMSDVLNASLITSDASAALAADDSDCANVLSIAAYNGSEEVTVSSYSKETGELSLDGTADKLVYTYITGVSGAEPMDVTVTLSGSDSEMGSSSSGCSLGFAALGLVIALSFFLF